MRIVGNNPQLSRQTQGTASGAITGGKPVLVNTDGTVTEISATAGAVGTAVAFESATTNYVDSVYEQNAQRVVIAYVDEGNSNYGTATVATVDSSDNSISYITPVVFHSGATKYVSVSSYINKVLIAYQDDGDGDKGKAVIGYNTSSSNISFGSDVEFEGGTTDYISSAWDTNSNKSVIVYRDASNSNYGTAVVATPSGATGVSFGTPVVFNSGNTVRSVATFDSSNLKIVIAYRDTGNSSHGTAIVGTVSGTSISFGSEVVFEAASTNYPAIAFDSNSNKVVITYQDQGNSNYGTAIVGTVSGTSISFGTAVVHRSANINEQSADFDTSKNVVILAYTDTGSSGTANKIMISEGTVSGTSISFSTAIAGSSGQTKGTRGVSFDTNASRTVVSYVHEGNSDYGTGIVYSAGIPTNITSENFIGFAEDTVATGQPVTINTKGAIADNIPQIASASSSVGTAVTFDSSSSTRIASCYDSTNNRIVVSYVDTGSDDDGTVAVGTVNASDNSISWGTPVAFNSNVKITDSSIVHDSNSNKIVIGYMDEDNSNYGTGIVGTIDTSDNSISFGSPTVYESASIATSSRNFGVFDSNSNKVIFGYQDDADSNKGKAVVGTVSGTSISFGSPVIFETGYAIHMDATFDTSNNKVVIAYRDYGNSDYGTAVVGTVSGTSISFGTPVVYNSAESDWNSATFDSSNNKVVISYQDKGNSSVGTAIVGTVSGTSISFGSEVVYSSGTATYTYATFDSNLNKVIIGYRNDASSDRGDFVIGTVSGTSISFNSPATFESDAVTWVRAAFDSSAKRTVFTFNEDNSAGKGVVMQPAGILEDIIPAQTYFVQTDGTLSQTADDPSVTAGTAVAGSTLIVKG